MLPSNQYLGSNFFKIYYSQKTHVRLGIKTALGNLKKESINPFDCIKTELYQNENKVSMIVESFNKILFYKTPIEILNWGCGLLIMNGHHRILASVILGMPNIEVSIGRYCA